jgi:hypothetical protein
MTVTEALQIRRSVPSFDTTAEITRAEVDAIVAKASLSPSSMNLEPIAVLLCHTAEEKARLVSVSMNQGKIAKASAAIVVLGLMDGHEQHADRKAQNNVDLGYIPEDRKEGWAERARGGWPTAEKQRDECFRAGSLWAMSFMLAAEEAGWVTAPMGGYVEADLQREFGLPDSVIPVLVIPIGKPDPAITLLPRGERIAPSELIHAGNW